MSTNNISTESKPLKRHFNAVFLIVILILLRIPTFIYPILDVDEAIYGLFSKIWFEGGIPYLNCVEMKPLGIYLTYGLIFEIFGYYNMIAIHIFTMIIVGITSYFLFKISKNLYSEKVGWWTALFYIVFSTTYIPKFIASTIEPIMILPIVLQFYYWIKFEDKNKHLYALLSGLFFSISFLFKYQAGINLAIILLHLGLIKPFILKQKPYIKCWNGFLYFIIAALPLPILMLGYLWSVGSLNDFFYWNIFGNLYYIDAGANAFSYFSRLLNRGIPFILSTILLWILLVPNIKHLFKKSFIKKDLNTILSKKLLILTWLILTIIPVNIGRRFYGHYFHLFLPSLCILAAFTANNIWQKNGKKWLKFAVIFWIVFPAIISFGARFNMDNLYIYFNEDNPKAYKSIAEYIHNNTIEEDKIAVWGFAPLIYWYSKRLPATRFFWSDVLTGRITGTKEPLKNHSEFIIPKAWTMFISDIQENKPKYIIDTSPGNLHDYGHYPIKNYPKFYNLIEKYYAREKQINGIVFYRLNEEL